MIGLISELKRRNVVRVAAAYMVVSWVMVQVISETAEILLLPEWAGSFVFFLLAVGFPITMLIAWAFEMTPEGLRRTKGGEAASGRVRIGDYVMLAAVVIIAGAMVYSVFLTGSGTGGGSSDRQVGGSAIAVLPFENLSVEAEEAMFSQALASDVRNRLSMVPGLQVASRSASIQFSDGASVREISRSLEVDAVLEGSVQKVGDQLRVTARLLDAKEGFQVWSATVDRDVTDLLAVQDDISDEIVTKVSGIMTGDAEQAPVELAEVADPAELFAMGRAEMTKRTPESLNAALVYFSQAMKADPDFADAYAGSAEVLLQQARSPETYGEMKVSDALSRARPYLTKAKSLVSEPSAYVKAIEGLFELTSGRTDNAIAALQSAVSIDPGLGDAHLWLYQAHLSTGQRLEAFFSLDQAFAADPDSLAVALNMSRLMAERKQLRDSEALLTRMGQLYPDNRNVSLARAALLADMWRPVEAINLLRGAYLDDPADPAVRLALGLTLLDIGAIDDAAPRLNDIGQWVNLSRGDIGSAVSGARAAYQAQPGSQALTYELADVEAVAGHDETVVDLLGPMDSGGGAVGPLFARTPILLPAVTLAQARRHLGDQAGSDALLRSVDAYLAEHRAAGIDTPQLTYLEARVLAVRGETEQAMAALSRAVLHRFAGISAVRWDPALASLRGLPEYQSLIADLNAEQAQQQQRISVSRGELSGPRKMANASNR